MYERVISSDFHGEYMQIKYGIMIVSIALLHYDTHGGQDRASLIASEQTTIQAQEGIISTSNNPAVQKAAAMIIKKSTAAINTMNNE